MIKLSKIYESTLLPFGEPQWNKVNDISKRSKNDEYLNGILASIKKQGYRATERQKNYVMRWLQSGKDGIQWGRKN